MTSPTEAKFHLLMSPVPDYDFDQLQNLISGDRITVYTREP